MNNTLQNQTTDNTASPRCACYPKFRLLDLYCKAGGCSAGYVRAGFEVTGVDIEPQKNYPYAFVQADAIEYVKAHGHEYDAIHASPPCQVHSMASQQWRKAGKEYPDLIDPTREALKATGKPYVIENVPGAPLVNPIVLNGAMFGLKVRRVRLFECSGFDVPFTLLPDDAPSTVRMGRPIKEGDAITPVGHFSNVPYARKQMEIDWMTGAELTQAIPPAYTEWIGNHLWIALEDNAVMTRQGNSKSVKPTSVIPGRVDKIVVREVYMFLDDPLTEAEREELQTLNDEVTTAINKRKEWLDKKMAEKAHLKIGDEIYDCRKGTKLGVVSRHYRYWADRDEGVRDSSLDINYEYETSPNCFDNTSRQIGVSFGSREDARKYAEMQARRLA